VNGPAAIAAAIRARQTFILTSHARPDGDAVGSTMALALALDQLGKTASVVLRDPVPEPYQVFPDVGRIRLTDRVTEPADAAVLLECSDLARPGIAGLDGYVLINIDHHLGNGMYGAVNWFDEKAAACGELVAAVIDALGVAWTPEIAAHLYLAVSTDTGGFRYGAISAATFEVCRRIAATGVPVAQLSRQIFDSFSIGRVRLTGAILNAMELHHENQLAVLAFDDDVLRRYGASIDDTEGLVNLPLAAREVQAVALFKRQAATTTYRVSLRSKGDVDVRAVAQRWDGGGHRNAAGCTMVGDMAALKSALVPALADAIDAARTDTGTRAS
jgi:phosphoesterase RecJ-like protein